MNTFRKSILALCTVSLSTASSAATTSASFGVSATVLGTCSVSATALNFGSITVPTIDTDVSSTVTATCAPGVAYAVDLGVGAGPGATFANRKLMNGANALNYSLFTTGSHTTVWGNGTGGSAQVAGTGTGIAQPLTVFGRLFAGQTMPNGVYSDTVQVTLNF